jgi:hypothetical protein
MGHNELAIEQLCDEIDSVVVMHQQLERLRRRK